MPPLSRALGHERLHSFDPIGTAEAYAKGVLLIAQACIELHRGSGPQSGLGLAQRESGFSRDLLRQLARLIQKLVCRDDFAGKAPFEGRLRVERVAGHDQFARSRMANPMG